MRALRHNIQWWRIQVLSTSVWSATHERTRSNQVVSIVYSTLEHNSGADATESCSGCTVEWSEHSTCSSTVEQSACQSWSSMHCDLHHSLPQYLSSVGRPAPGIKSNRVRACLAIRSPWHSAVKLTRGTVQLAGHSNRKARLAQPQTGRQRGWVRPLQPDECPRRWDSQYSTRLCTKRDSRTSLSRGNLP